MILKIHDEYKSQLFRSNLISIDQLIADFSRYLDSHVWDALKERSGFDAIFVDEAHLFNASEQGILPKLLRTRSRVSDGRPIFIAYDMKQTSREPVDDPTEDSQKLIRANVLDVALIDLDKVFRFTKQIAALIEAIVFEVGAFDHLDEAERAVGSDSEEPGALPTVLETSSDLELYNTVFVAARKASEASGRRGQVAVICFDARKFSRYAEAGAHKGKFMTVEEKSDLNRIRFSGKRFIFSEPEQLAGHQFDAVFVVNVDAVLFEHTESALESREAFSRLYLALTRASKQLAIVSSKDGGGLPKFLQRSLQQGLARGDL